MLNLFDLTAAVIIVGLSALGFRDGFVRQAVKLAGFVITIVILAAFSGLLVDLALSFEHLNPVVSMFLVFGTAFLVFMLGFHIAALLISKMVAITPVWFIDAGFGGVLGSLKGIVFCGFLALLMSGSPNGSFFQQQYRGSALAGPLHQFILSAIPFVKSASDTVLRHWDRFRNFEEREDNDASRPVDI